MPKKSVVKSNNKFNKWFWLILGIVIGLLIATVVVGLANKKVGLSPPPEKCYTICEGNTVTKVCFIFDESDGKFGKWIDDGNHQPVTTCSAPNNCINPTGENAYCQIL